ncbi:MAG: hypothetical protein ACE5GB_00275 [Acidimicrobiales bacterium]
MLPPLKRSLGSALLALLVATSCSSGDSTATPESVVDLVDPCQFATSAMISGVMGVEVVRASAGNTDPDRYLSCRWVAAPTQRSPADEPDLDYLDEPVRPFVDIVVRQTVTGDTDVGELFATAATAENSRPVPDLVAGGHSPRLADEAVRTDTSLWALKGERLVLALTDAAASLDALIELVLPQLIRRL